MRKENNIDENNSLGDSSDIPLNSIQGNPVDFWRRRSEEITSKYTKLKIKYSALLKDNLALKKKLDTSSEDKAQYSSK